MTPPPRALPVTRQDAPLRAVVPWAIAAIVVGFLYFARSVLIPITLAALLSFLISPLVALARRARLPRPAAILVAMSVAIGGIVLTAAILIGQASSLRADAPVYAVRVIAKVRHIRQDLEGRFSFANLEAMRSRPRPSAAERENSRSQVQGSSAPVRGATPVVLADAPPTMIDEFRDYALPVVAPVETALIVLVVTIFFLLQKEDLRDRLIRLMGSADLHRTTLAFDDAARRLSRYFLAQSLVNAAFGGVIWLGLWLLGIPAPGLWGILAGLLRFIPYVGILIAAIGPLALAAATAPGIGAVLAVAALFVLIEPLVGYVVEPMLYGRSTGLSPVSVVVAAIFWTWIWGPVGLVLAMPLTLMLVVLGRHIPAFEFFDILLGDRPPLSAAETFYQRALAMGPEEAIEHAEEQLDQMPLLRYYDDVALAGLRLAADDVARGAVDRSAMLSVCETVVELVESLKHHAAGDPAEVASRPLDIWCVAGKGPLDVAVAAMARQLLEGHGARVHAVTRGSAQEETLPDGQPDVICLLGLFDRRSHRRLGLIAAHFARMAPAARVYIAVDRAVDPAVASNDDADVVTASFTHLIDAVRARTPSGFALPTDADPAASPVVRRAELDLS